MNRGTVIRFAVSLLIAFPAVAQNALEIIDLRHRTAEQVIPTLQPLLEPGATLSGQGAQLFVRASPANLAIAVNLNQPRRLTRRSIAGPLRSCRSRTARR